MGNFRPMTKAQFAAFDEVITDLPLLDTEFDGELDFADMHMVELELSNQSNTHDQL